ncbi:CYIR protein, partial [Plasmodium cynomolgi strain B]
FSECREMKHLYEYFNDYETIKEKINCGLSRQDKYFKYLTYISSLYNKHKDEEGCCSWGANMCPYYFLQCDEAYDPRKLIRVIESGNSKECNDIKESAGVIKTAQAKSEEEKLRNSMYIKYMTCSYIPGSRFNKKGLICQQQSKRPHMNNKFLSRYTSYNAPVNISDPINKNITINGKPMNVVLISNPSARITTEDEKKER